MIKDFMEYHGYYGSVHFDSREKIFYGKIEFIRDLVNYEASEAKALLDAFYDAVDSYLADCKLIKKQPDRPFKGNFNVRVEPELHKRAYLYGLQHGKKLNNVVKEALTDYLDSSTNT